MHLIPDDENAAGGGYVLILERHDLLNTAPEAPGNVQLTDIKGSSVHAAGASKVLLIEKGRIIMLKNRHGYCGDVDAVLEHAHNNAV